jgi:hypothetical protein
LSRSNSVTANPCWIIVTVNYMAIKLLLYALYENENRE